MLFILALPALFSGMYQLACHLLVEMWFPHLPAVPRYILGTLGMAVPPTVAIVAVGLCGWMAVLVFWLSIGASGLAVLGIRHFGKRYSKLLDDLDDLERLRRLLSRIENAQADEAE